MRLQCWSCREVKCLPKSEGQMLDILVITTAGRSKRDADIFGLRRYLLLDAKKPRGTNVSNITDNRPPRSETLGSLV